MGLYEVLGVDASASKPELGRAYRRLALKHHPDKSPPENRDAAAVKFREVAQAYEVLSDDDQRRRYDRTGAYDDQERQPSEYDVFFNNFFGEAAMGSDSRSADYSYHKLANYEQLTLKEQDLPEYIRDIVKVGLNYLTVAVEDIEAREVVMLRHTRVDILYLMVAYIPPLSQESCIDNGYIIHYYDNPLQSAITPIWSDQNVAAGNTSKHLKLRSMRQLSTEQFKRRQSLEEKNPADNPMARLQEKYAYGPPPLSTEVPAEALASGDTSHTSSVSADTHAPGREAKCFSALPRWCRPCGAST